MYGQILRKLREAKGRAQAEVARKAEISPAQLARLEMNQRGLYVEDFVRIAEVLGEKAGNLLPNDLGRIGHLKPLIDRLAGVQPEFLERVESIVAKVILLTDQVMPAAHVPSTHAKVPPSAIVRLEKILDDGSTSRRRFAGTVSAEKVIEIVNGVRGSSREIPAWARQQGARGVLKAAGTSLRDVGIFDGDMLFVKPDRNPASGKLVICTVDDRLFVKIIKRDRGGRAVQLGSKSPGWPPIGIRADENVKFYFVVLGISGSR